MFGDRCTSTTSLVHTRLVATVWYTVATCHTNLMKRQTTGAILALLARIAALKSSAMVALLARIAAIAFVAAGCFRGPVPLEVVAITLLWTFVSAHSQRQSCPSLLPWVSEHNLCVVVATISFAVFGHGRPDMLAHTCCWLVGELLAGLPKAWLDAQRAGQSDAKGPKAPTRTPSVAASAEGRKSAKSAGGAVPRKSLVSVWGWVLICPLLKRESDELLSLALERFQVESYSTAAHAPSESTPPTLQDTYSFTRPHYQGACYPLVLLLSTFVTLTIALGIFIPGVHTSALAAANMFLICICLRLWIHGLADQQLARILFGRSANILTCVFQFHLFFSARGSYSKAVFLYTRLVWSLIAAYQGYSALDRSHRLAFVLIVLGGSTVSPPISHFDSVYSV